MNEAATVSLRPPAALKGESNSDAAVRQMRLQVATYSASVASISKAAAISARV
jgi:hypothetical protein